jgi:hypothetical protein
MPAVLVLILCVVHAAIRREGLPAVGASTVTASDLIAALQIAREVENARRAADNEKPIPAPEPGVMEDTALDQPKPEDTKPALPDENVTSLSSARYPK